MQEGESGWSKAWAYIARKQGNVIFGKKHWYAFDEETKLWRNDLSDTDIGNYYAIPQLKAWATLMKSDIRKASKVDGVDYIEVVNDALDTIMGKLSCYSSIARGARFMLCNRDFGKTLNMSSPTLLPIKGGEVVDLETGKVRTRVASDLFDYECDVTMGTSPDDYSDGRTKPTPFEVYLENMWPDRHERRWMQQFAGLVISGIRYKGFFYFLGESSTGKSSFVTLLQRMLGDKAAGACGEGVVEKSKSNKSDGSATTQINEMLKFRLAVCPEFSKGGVFYNRSIKMLTGGDKLALRKLHAEEESITVMTTLLVHSNNVPRYEPEPGMDSRLHMITFTQVFVDEPDPKKPEERQGDPYLEEKIINNEDGFVDDCLAWAVQGAKKFIANGKKLPELPPDFKKMRDEVISKSNAAKTYVDTQLESDTKSKLLAKELLEQFLEWCEEEDVDAPSQTALGKELSGAGYTRTRSSVRGVKGTVWLGVKFVDDK